MPAMSTYPAALAPYMKTIAPYLQDYGYWAVFLGVMLEDFGVPAPGETILIAGALFAAMGNLKVEWVGVAGLLGAVLGDNLGYAIGFFGGRRLLLKYGRYVLLDIERLHRMENFFARHGGKVVTIARFIEGLRQFNGILAGASRMHWMRFLSFNVVGAVLWVTTWVSAAYLFGNQLGTILKTFKRFEIYILIGAGAVVLVYAGYRLVKMVRNHKNDR